MTSHWQAIGEALARLGCGDQVALNRGASKEALDELERHLGLQLPIDLKDFLSVHDGQAGRVFRPGLAYGDLLLSVAGIRAEWDGWRSIDEAYMNADCAEFMRSRPEGFIKPMYTNPKWIPLTHDGGGNHIGLDFDPEAQGTPGQVIRFGRDEDEKVLLASTFSAFLDQLVTALQSATWNGEDLDWQ